MATLRPITSPSAADKQSATDNHAKRGPRSWLGERLVLDARDPAPLQDAATFWRAVAQGATVLMAILAFGVFLYFAGKLVVPVLAAFVVGMTFGPAIGYATKKSIPAWVVAIAILLLLIAVLNIAIVTLAQPITDLLGRAPELGVAIKEKLQLLDRPLAALYELQSALGVGAGRGVEVSHSRVLEGMVTIITPAAVQFAMQLVLFFGTLFFYIIGRAQFRQYAVSWFTEREARLRALKILNDIEDNMGGYLIVVTAINLSLGVVTFVMAYLLGLPAPLLWGALAFGLNYIPYVGPAIMYVLLFVIGLMTYPTILGALLPPGIFMAITLIEGQFLSPAIVGRRVLSIHPLSIFLGIAFWAWIWGPMGAFLATPMLIAARVVHDHVYPQQKAELPG
jgi:predicted PurR-regulated permease PerM